MSAIVHQAPPDGDGLTPCCGLPVFELPHGDRLTVEPWGVTCGVKSSLMRGIMADLEAAVAGMVTPKPAPPLFIPRSTFDAMVAVDGRERAEAVVEDTVERFGFSGWELIG